MDVHMRKVSLAEVQAYIILRGSGLTPEDKKRVLVEAGAEQGGSLTMQKVQAAVRMLGFSFFQEVTAGKKDKSLKTYDNLGFTVEDEGEEGESWAFVEESLDEDSMEQLALEDPVAALIVQFEQAIQDVVQEDAELSTFYTSYQEARKRLQERVKARGFGAQETTKGRGKGRAFKANRGFKSLQQRCWLCGERRHWKVECPSKKPDDGSNTEKNAIADISHPGIRLEPSA